MIFRGSMDHHRVQIRNGSNRDCSHLSMDVSCGVSSIALKCKLMLPLFKLFFPSISWKNNLIVESFCPFPICLLAECSLCFHYICRIFKNTSYCEFVLSYLILQQKFKMFLSFWKKKKLTKSLRYSMLSTWCYVAKKM